MLPVDDPLPPALTKRMIRDHCARMTHDNATRADDNLDSLADQAPGNRIAVGVQIDGAVGLDAPNKVAQLPEWRPTAERLQRPASRLNRSIGASPVVPWRRTSATSRTHCARCASNAGQLAKRRPATALRFT